MDFVDVPSATLWKFPSLPKFLQWVRVFSPFPKVDLLHTYNHLVLNDRPWVVSFESFLPRFQASRDNKKAWCWGFEKLASDSCKRILPISKAARNLFYLMAEKHGYSKELFRHKTQIIYPAVDVSSFKKKDYGRNNGTVRLLFVGNSFFRKGGRPLLQAFQKLSKHFDIELTVISTLTLPDFFTHSDESDRRAAINHMMADTRITWLQNVLNSDLRNRVFPTSDIFVLPTLQDSFGFVNIEAMACGLPVVSTSQFAIPEQISHNVSGFIIDVPLDEAGRLQHLSEMNPGRRKQMLSTLEAHIQKQLECLLVSFIENGKMREEFGNAGRRIARQKFSVIVRNRTLISLYKDVLK